MPPPRRRPDLPRQPTSRQQPLPARRPRATHPIVSSTSACSRNSLRLSVNDEPMASFQPQPTYSVDIPLGDDPAARGMQEICSEDRENSPPAAGCAFRSRGLRAPAPRARRTIVIKPNKETDRRQASKQPASVNADRTACGAGRQQRVDQAVHLEGLRAADARGPLLFDRIEKIAPHAQVIVVREGHRVGPSTAR